jgi:MFS family permease
MLSCYSPQYSVFGSIITIGAMIGAVASGHLADISGRKGVSTSLNNLLSIKIFVRIHQEL